MGLSDWDFLRLHRFFCVNCNCHKSGDLHPTCYSITLESARKRTVAPCQLLKVFGLETLVESFTEFNHRSIRSDHLRVMNDYYPVNLPTLSRRIELDALTPLRRHVIARRTVWYYSTITMQYSAVQYSTVPMYCVQREMQVPYNQI